MDTPDDERIHAILLAHDRRADTKAVAHLREEMETARHVLENAAPRALPKREARKLLSRARVLRSQLGAIEIKIPNAEQVLTDIEAVAEKHIQLPALRGRPGRQWLWTYCAVLLACWVDLAKEPNETDAIWNTDDKFSPALMFLIDCFQCVDETITPDVIVTASRKARKEYEKNGTANETEQD